MELVGRTSKYHRDTAKPFFRAADVLESTVHSFEAIPVLSGAFIPDNQFRATDKIGQRCLSFYVADTVLLNVLGNLES